MQNNDDTWCVLPWSHLYVGPNGKIAPCCVGKTLGEYGDTTLEEAWNSDAMKQLRIDMTNGVKNDICSSCYKKEDMGFKSMRQNSNVTMKDVADVVRTTSNSDGSIDEFKLYYLDLRFNNLCNFKCRTCNPFFSSSVAVEHMQNTSLKKFHKTPERGIIQNNNILSEIEKQYPNVTRIYFAGGEPMMQEEHWNILKYYVDNDTAKNVGLVYSTNTSRLTYKTNSVFDYWKHFKSVHVQTSIDAEGKRAEYWRDGTVWEDILANIKLIKESKVQWSIHSVISWANVYSYVELVKTLLQEKLSLGYNFTIWCLDESHEFNLQELPDFKKQEIASMLDTFIVELEDGKFGRYLGEPVIKTNIENIKMFMFAKSIPINKEKFEKHFILDGIRNKDFFEYFPEHENMREYIQ
jgi:MoaA/NifB/PqqE/SkfB family radical SAM enzyme